MVARPGHGQQSTNAGEFSPDMAGRIDVKQYYSAGLRFLNIEPVPQGGFRNFAGTKRIAPVSSSQAPIYGKLDADDAKSYTLAVLPGRVDIFDDLVVVAQPSAAALTATAAAAISIYAEADTIGLFHKDMVSQRIVRSAAGAIWTVDDWPYAKIPDVQYGGVYAKTDDEWEVWFRWATGVTVLLVSYTVDGEETGSLAYSDAVGTQAALEALPSLGPGVTATFIDRVEENTDQMDIAFGGNLSGVEYDLSVKVLNTSNASALSAHRTIGETTGEPAISPARGWPALGTIVQDRFTYAGLKSRGSALLFSRVAEYFDLNIKSQREDGAKLEAIRTQSAEQILEVVDSKYLLVFTDKAEYFATNRAIVRDEPLNFVETGRNKLARGCRPYEIENRIYFPALPGKAPGKTGGNVLVSTAYDDVSTAFTARQESLLSSHLVENIVQTAIQRGADDTDATRLWLRRGDGRLVCAIVIRDQDITGFCEYAVGAPVRAIGVDGQNRLWLTVERTRGGVGVLGHEILDPESYLFGGDDFVSDASGRVTGLDHDDGAELWAETADGYTLGPFTVAAGAIETAWPSTAMTIGEWSAPRFETMPRVKVNRDDTITRRPGRIHTVTCNVIATTSIAIGANGEPPRDVSLARIGDQLDAPTPARTEAVTVAGLDGVVENTTAVITQLRPGALRVRDLTLQEKL